MTPEYRVCLATVDYRVGQVWLYETAIRGQKSNPIRVRIETVDFGLTENGTMCRMFGRRFYPNGEMGLPEPLFDYNMLEQVEEVAA